MPPITYRDEEVEKLIKRMFEFAIFKVYACTEMQGPEAEAYIRSMLRDVEILSARRARDKAIEECAEVCKSNGIASLKEGDKDMKHWDNAYESILKLKSQPQ